MSETPQRPRAVSVIGYAVVPFGLLLFASGLAATLDPDHVFEHPFVVGTGQIALALVAITAACALLRLRAWGALVLEVLAIVFLVCVLAFAALHTWLTFPFAWMGAPGGIRMVSAGLLVMLFYALPLVLTVRSLRKLRQRGVLA